MILNVTGRVEAWHSAIDITVSLSFGVGAKGVLLPLRIPLHYGRLFLKFYFLLFSNAHPKLTTGIGSRLSK